MYIPKKYGESRVDNCPFCGKISTIKNSQGVLVCRSHKNSKLNNLKCVCGGWLDLNQGKWGPYFHCINCGNKNFKKGLEMNPQATANQPKSDEKQAPKEITVRSDQLDFL